MDSYVQSTATLTIFEADALPAVQFSAANYAVAKADGTATISVSLSAPCTQAVTINYETSNGTATHPQDYSPASGALTFPPGETISYFQVAIVNNPETLPDRTVNLTLSSPQNATLGFPSTAILTITETLPTVTFSPNPVYVDQGESAPLTATVSPSSAAVFFVSADPTIATVTPGPAPDLTVYGVGVGTTQILAMFNGAEIAFVNAVVTQKKAAKTIYVYAFEGAGAKIGLGLDPLNTVGRQAIQTGATNIEYTLVYRYHSWTLPGFAAAEAKLAVDLVKKKPGDKFITIGYSLGGKAAHDFAILNKLTVNNLVFTIDPVAGIPGVPFLPLIGGEAAWKKTWVNYWQNLDKKSLAGFPIPGQQIKGTDNKNLIAGDFTKQEFYLDGANKATEYPGGALFAKETDHAHVWIPYNKVLLEDLQKRIEDLK